MISPWEIYWVMQLDSIGAATRVLAVISALVAAAVWMVAGFMAMDAYGDDDKAAAKKFAAYGFKPGIAAGVLLFASAFIPSTKTAAAMFVIPAIANNEAIQREAGDLYQLAKDGLRELVKPEQAEKVEK